MRLVNHGYIASIVMRRAVQVFTTVSVILPSFFVIRHLVHTYKMSKEWLVFPVVWSNDNKAVLLSEKNIQPIPKLNVRHVIEKSSQFPVAFPIETVRCHFLKSQGGIPTEELEKNINSAYPVIHEHALLLCAIFLNYQKEVGNKEFYKDMTLLQFIDRLLSKRAVAFVGAHDDYLLLNRQRGHGHWENVGTPHEIPPLTLENCLSYDEMKLSALLSVSSHSSFINDGSRSNFGEFERQRDKIERRGVIIGLIGARLEKRRVMEYREIVKSEDQNTMEYGYGIPNTLQAKFLEFYDDDNAIYADLLDKMKSKPERYTPLRRGDFFDRLMFERRIALSIDTLLIEANERARNEGKKAYIHVVGLGLGVWKICRDQDQIFMDTFAKRLELLKEKLVHVSDVRFAYIRHNMAGSYKHGDRINGIQIHMENRNPQERLTGSDEGKLLVVSYPWDGNAFPGNEFWFGVENLGASGDPAAASSSQIAELHNYYINDKVCARNLKVATLNHGIVDFDRYQELHKDD